MDNALTFTLIPAEPKDIPRMAQITVRACSSDNAYKLCFATRAQFKNSVTQTLTAQIGDPNWHHVKAVLKDADGFAAWASWNTPTETQTRERDENARARISGTPKDNDWTNISPKLAAFVQDDTYKWLDRWTRGKRHMICDSLFTEPVFQRRGLGSALLEYGCQMADWESLPIYLRGNVFCRGICLIHKFQTVKEFDVDLREWEPRNGGRDIGYGNYRFFYMMRLPGAVPQESG